MTTTQLRSPKLDKIQELIDSYYKTDAFPFRPSEIEVIQAIRVILDRAVGGHIAVADGVGPHPYLRLHTVRESGVGYRGMGVRTWCNAILINGHTFNTEEEAKQFALTKHRLGRTCPRCRDMERSS